MKVIPKLKDFILDNYQKDTIYSDPFTYPNSDKIIEQYGRCYELTTFDDRILYLRIKIENKGCYTVSPVISVYHRCNPLIGLFHCSKDLRVIEIYDEFLRLVRS